MGDFAFPIEVENEAGNPGDFGDWGNPGDFGDDTGV